jgi:hypothetical protein
VGKTRVVIFFIKHLLASPDYSHVGVLLLLRTYKETDDLTQETGLRQDEFAVLVSENDITSERLSKIGNPDKSRARVLITTHSMFESRIKRAANVYNAVEEFRYNGKPREVRVWDEACLPARPIVLPGRLINKMKDVTAHESPTLHELLKRLADDVMPQLTKGENS